VNFLSFFIAERGGEPLGVKHLLHGVDRELMKEGRVLSEGDRQRLQIRID